MSFYVYAWIATVVWGLVVFISKLTSKYAVSNPWLFNFFWSLLVLLFTFPVATVNKVGFPQEWYFIVVGGLFGALWNIFFVLSTYKLDVSVLVPLFNFRAVFAVLFGALLVNESLSFANLRAVALPTPLEDPVITAILFFSFILSKI